jgi:hypothetical protein
MLMGVKVFWLEPTDLERVTLRRYRSSSFAAPDGSVVTRAGCPLPQGYHDRSVIIIDQRPCEDHSIADPDYLQEQGVFSAPTKDDPRWPTHCDCGYAFAPDDPWQVFPEQLFRGAPDGLLYTLRAAPPGAMWDATWLKDTEWAVGPDGISLHVRLPNGHDWCVDQEASNCTRTQWLPGTYVGGDGVERHAEKMWKGRTHYCWIRHGDPRTGNVHVDKDGDTCAAGAGSIQSGNYHGFLHNGELT